MCSNKKAECHRYHRPPPRDSSNKAGLLIGFGDKKLMKAFLTFLTFDDGIKKYTACYEMVICVEYKRKLLNCCVEITFLGGFHVMRGLFWGWE